MMEEELELSDYWNIVKNQWKLIALVLVVVLAIAGIYSYLASPVYEARTLVVVTNQDYSSLILSGISLPRIDITTETEIIRSQAVLGVVLKAAKAKYDVSVEPVRDSSAIEIIVHGGTPDGVQKVANAIALRYVNYSIEARKADAVAVTSFMTGQIVSLEEEIDMINLEILEMDHNKSLDAEYALQTLTSTLSAKEKLHSYLLNRREEIGIFAQQSQGNVRIVEYAEAPVWPVRPNLVLNLAVGIVLGIFAGVALAFMREYGKNAIQRVSDAEAFGTVLGTLPHAKGKGLFQSSAPHSVFSEKIRLLQTHLVFALNDQYVKVLAVCSPEQKDGKTTVAANLAHSLALHDVEVLLIDANLRDGPIFGHKGPGLSEYLQGEAEADSIVSDHHGIPFISSKAVERPIELIVSPRMKSLFSKLAKEYSIIIVDTPSLEFAEGALIASQCDGALIVLAQGKTSKDASDKAKRTLHRVKARIIGTVLNFAR